MSAALTLVALSKLKNDWPRSGALPWNVVNRCGSLLLAKGWGPCTPELLQDLLAKSAYVETQEGAIEKSALASAPSGPGNNFFERWSALYFRLSRLLARPQAEDYVENLVALSIELRHLVLREPDRAVYAVIAHDYQQMRSYAVAHSLHCAAAATLVATRLQYPPHESSTLVVSALSMNAPIMALQDRLTQQAGPLLEMQRAQVRAHPEESAKLLEAAGADPLWVQTVREHHEEPGGEGYPQGLREVSPHAQDLRLIDVFLAKHAPRAERKPLPSMRAAQQLFVAHKDRPAAAALVKEFGAYPPGSRVELASGELAIVLRRGQSAMAPLAVALTDSAGMPVSKPTPRDTEQERFAIARAAPAHFSKRLVCPDELYARV